MNGAYGQMAAEAAEHLGAASAHYRAMGMRRWLDASKAVTRH